MRPWRVAPGFSVGLFVAQRDLLYRQDQYSQWVGLIVWFLSVQWRHGQKTDRTAKKTCQRAEGPLPASPGRRCREGRIRCCCGNKGPGNGLLGPLKATGSS